MGGTRTLGILLVGFASYLSQPSMARSAAAHPIRREITGWGGKITVVSRRDGQTELLDENSRASYATDSAISDKKLTKLANGDLSYRTERGDTVTIHADGRRTTSLRKPQITVTESLGADGKPLTTEFTIGQDVKLNSLPMAGRWVRAERSRESFRLVVLGTGQPRTLLGNLELTDLYNGEVRFSDAAAHVRETYRRDGYIKRENLDPQNVKAVRTIESFPEGHELDRTVLSPSAIETLQKEGCEVKPDQHVERVLLIDARGNITNDLVEVLRDGKPHIVRLEDSTGTAWIRITETFYGDKWLRRRHGAKESDETFGQIQRIGADTVRTTYPADYRVFTDRSDGSWMHELKGERIYLTQDLKLEAVEVPGYIIRRDVRGSVDVTDPHGDRFSVDSPLESNRLTIDPKTGDLTFFDRHDDKVTLHSGGNRTLAYKKGLGPTAKFDAGGRMYRTYNLSGEFLDQRAYTRGPNDRYYLSKFEDKERAVWELMLLANGGQKWSLMNGANGLTVSLDATTIAMTRQNSFALTFDDHREIRTLNGTYISQAQVIRPNGDREAEVKVGVGSLEKPVYRLLTTYNRQGQLIRQELKSKAGRFVRGDDGVDIKKSPFREVDNKGQKIPGTSTWLGFIAVDEEGTLIKYSFAPSDGGEAPSGNGTVSNVKYAASEDAESSRPFVPNTYYLFTDGESEQRYENGAIVYRDREGDIWKIQTITGEVFRLHYDNVDEGNGKKIKRIAALVENGVVWKYERQRGDFTSKGRVFNNILGESLINMTVNGARGVLGRTIIPSHQRFRSFLDGGVRFEGPQGRVIETNGQGFLTKLVDGRENQFEVESGADGHPMRIDLATAISVVDKDYAASAKKPLNKKELRGTKLALRGFGVEKYASYTNAAGHEVNQWLDGNSEEFDASPGTKVIAVTTSTGIVRHGEPAKLLLDHFKDVVTEIEPWRGEGDDRHFIYRDKAGRLIKHYSSGAMLIYDAQHRLMQTTDFSGRIWTLTYATAADRLPIKVASEKFELVRDSKAGTLERKILLDGKVAGSLAAKSFSVDEHANLILEFQDDQKSEIALEVVNLWMGRRAQLERDGRLFRLDSRNRPGSAQLPQGVTLYANYEKQDVLPESIASAYGTWKRSKVPLSANGDVYRWTESKTKETWDGTIAAFWRGGPAGPETTLTRKLKEGGTETWHEGEFYETIRDKRTISATDAAGRITTYEYSPKGTLISAKVTDRVGKVSQLTVGQAGITALRVGASGHLEYDKGVAQTIRHWTNGLIVTFAKDQKGQLEVVSIVTPDDRTLAQGTVANNSSVTSFTLKDEDLRVNFENGHQERYEKNGTTLFVDRSQNAVKSL